MTCDRPSLKIWLSSDYRAECGAGCSPRRDGYQGVVVVKRAEAEGCDIVMSITLPAVHVTFEDAHRAAEEWAAGFDIENGA